MGSELARIFKSIDFDFAQQLDLAVAKSLSFVPVCMQENIYYVVVNPSSNIDEIKKYLSKFINNQITFISRSNEEFKSLFESYSKELSSRCNISIPEDENGTEEENSDKDNYSNIDLDDDIDDYFSIENCSDDELALDDEMLDLDLDDYQESDSKENDFKEDDSNEVDLDDEETDSEDDDLQNIEISDDTESEESNNNSQEKSEQNVTEKPRIEKVKAPQTKKLGEILIEEELITNEQLNIALSESKAQNLPLGHILVKLGYVDIKDLREALGAQMGLQTASEEQLNKQKTNIISIFPEDFIRMNKVIPINMTDKVLVVGMVNPNDTKVINEMVFQTGLRPEVRLVTHVEFENFLNTYFSKDREETENLYQQIEEDNSMLNQTNLQDDAAKETVDSDGAVSQLANKIITMAIERRASDIHIEPLNVGYRVRFRIDGSLHEILKIPQKIDSAVISRYKVLSRMNIAEHRRAQDGSFTVKFNGRPQDFRVNTLPVAGKEKMVIRVLAPQMDSKAAKADKIEIVGASDEDIKKINYLVSCPHGIILTSGPTGSGKTTTLYSVLRYINSDDVNITTIEDPVEIKLEGINQSAVNNKAGITFANSLRAILRQDPDTILIGEIRDYETLEVAISASLTGHLVLSTIHTNSAAATITRLIEMGAKDYLISSTLAGVLAQRLVKRLCPYCKEAYYPTEEEARKVLTDPAEIQELTTKKLYKPVGCSNCRNTGYLGRLAVLEIMVLNNDIRKMIAQRAHDVEIEEYAVKHGMKTLRMSCMRHVLEGETSAEELIRTLGLANED